MSNKHRKSLRLKGYDYSQNGVYFITICAEGRQNRFGKIRNGEMLLNDAGKMINSYWNILSERFLHIILDTYVVMPNHFHGIITIIHSDNPKLPIVGAGLVPALAGNTPNHGQPQGIAPTNGQTIGKIIGAFKSLTTDEYIKGVKYNNWPRFNKRIWQRNYYEHIIRTEEDLNAIREYIQTNPQNWEKDELFEK